MWVLYSENDLVLRAMEEQDVPLVARWRSDPRVVQDYAVFHGPMSEGQARAEFLGPGRSRDTATGRFYEYRACIVDQDAVSVAFVQYHRLRTSDATLLGYPREERSYEMDLFIGDLDRRGRGLGTRIIGLTRVYLEKMRGSERTLAVPFAENLASIRAFEKAGFRKVRVVEGAYRGRPGRGDGVIMEYP